MTTQKAADRSGLPELDITAEDLRNAADEDATFASHLAVLRCRERQFMAKISDHEAALKRIQELESGLKSIADGNNDACCGEEWCTCPSCKAQSTLELAALKEDRG